MTPSDNLKDEVNGSHKNIAKFIQGQDFEKNSKLTATPYLTSYPPNQENETQLGGAPKPKARMRRQTAHKRPLTKREEEIVRLISGGLRNKDVAKVLGISVKTVETHRVNIMNKLALQNLAQLIRYAVQKGLIQIEVDK